MVTCTAKDTAGNQGSASFSVLVQSASQQLTNLLTAVQSVVIDAPTSKNLLSIIQNAQDSLAKGDTAGTCDKLSSFINQVQAQSGKKIAKATADGLLVDATRIKAVVGCQ